MAKNAHDILAEQALLGAAILVHEQVQPAFLSVPEQAYYSPKHQVLAGLIRDMVVRRQPVDEITVLSALQDAGLIGRVGGAPYLHTLVSRPYTALHAQFYASRIVELFGRRKLWEALAREQQLLDADWESGELSRPVAASVGGLRATCDEVMRYSVDFQVSESLNLDEFLGERDTYDWLVPGLLERTDRLILTGAEGFGKTELATQLVMAVAGSVHPFTGQPTEHSEPRVLIVDCENSTTQSRRRFRRIAGAVESARAMWEAPAVAWGKRLKVEFRPGGIDLLAPSDLSWLESVIAGASPDLVAIGPLYKLHNGNINDGEMAGALLRNLDRLREQHQFALVTEAHASKAQGPNGQRSMEPEGSALFIRWPEFGFGLRRNKDNPMDQADMSFWRGSREERAWPGVLHRRHTGLLPWGPDGDYYHQLEGHRHLTDGEMTIR